MSGENDLLERATRALRAVPPPTDEELAAGRARLLAAQNKGRGKNPARTLRWVLPLAAVLVAGSALAATTGQVERMVRAVSELLQSEPPEHARKTKKKRAQPDAVARSPEAPLPPPLPVPPTPEPPPATVPASTSDATSTDSGVDQESEREAAAEAERAARRNARRHARERNDAEAREAARERDDEAREADDGEASESARRPAEEAEPEQASAPVPDADLARYREAHRLHFRARDFAAALRAWDAYLSAFPNGVFAIEARYNRAICLVRLGRKEEARRALTPFARGEVGRGYRKADATKLLEALE